VQTVSLIDRSKERAGLTGPNGVPLQGAGM